MRPEATTAEPSVIRLEGSLDGMAARRVEALLTRAEPGAGIQIDLTHIREFHDFAVAVLANALTRCRAAVSVRGLRLHQIRLLRYLGVDAVQTPRVTLLDAA